MALLTAAVSSSLVVLVLVLVLSSALVGGLNVYAHRYRVTPCLLGYHPIGRPSAPVPVATFVLMANLRDDDDDDTIPIMQISSCCRGFELVAKGSKIRGMNPTMKIALMWLASLTFLVSPLSIGTVHAKIPSMDDYSLGSGVKIRDMDPKSAAAALSAWSFDLSESKVTYKLFHLEEIVTQISRSFDQEAWDDVIKLCRYLKKDLRADCFGYDGLQKLSTALQLSEERAVELDGMRAELSYLLGQVDDFSVSNRLYYFNKEDLKLTQLLMEDTAQEGGVDVTAMRRESMQQLQPILSDAVTIAKRMATLLV